MLKKGLLFGSVLLTSQIAMASPHSLSLSCVHENSKIDIGNEAEVVVAGDHMMVVLASQPKQSAMGSILAIKDGGTSDEASFSATESNLAGRDQAIGISIVSIGVNKYAVTIALKSGREVTFLKCQDSN